jgi:ribosomal protein S18 acetylase RimI-like enzyme
MRIRPGHPTDADASAFAELANMASHDILTDQLGPGHADILGAMYLAGDNLYTYRRVWFIEAGGKVAGMLCGFTGQQKADLNPATDQYFIDFPGSDAEPFVTIRNQLEPLSNLIDSVPIDAWYIQFLAVYPNARGHGCARQLLAHAHDLARENGATTLELDVETGNEAALAAYRGAGFEVRDTSPYVTYDRQQRALALHRMVKELSSSG